MNRKILTFACLVMLVIALSGCISSDGDKDMETIKDSNMESNAEQNKESDSNNYFATNEEWPSNIPDFVPEFTHGKDGKIAVNGEDGIQWIIAYSDVPDDVLEKYASDLESKGWETTISRSFGESLFAERGEYIILLIHFKESQAAQLDIHTETIV